MKTLLIFALLTSGTINAQTPTEPKVVYSKNCGIGVNADIPTDDAGNKKFAEEVIEILKAKGFYAHFDYECKSQWSAGTYDCDYTASFDTRDNNFKPTFDASMYEFTSAGITNIAFRSRRAGLIGLFSARKNWYLDQARSFPDCVIRI